MNVFEVHTDECKAAMVAQNKTIEEAQRIFALSIADIRKTEDAETVAARSRADAAIDVARGLFDDAIAEAQKVYGETIQESRTRAWEIIQKRLSVWNGEVPDDQLPTAPTIAPAAQPQAAVPKQPDVREFVLVDDLDFAQRSRERGSSMIEAMAPYIVDDKGVVVKSFSIEDEPAALGGLPKIPLSAIYTRVKSNGGNSGSAADCLRAIAELIAELTNELGALDDKAA